jgi:hypothetical protein
MDINCLRNFSTLQKETMGLPSDSPLAVSRTLKRFTKCLMHLYGDVALIRRIWRTLLTKVVMSSKPRKISNR